MRDFILFFCFVFLNFVNGDEYGVTIPTASGGYIEIPSARNSEDYLDKPSSPQWTGPESPEYSESLGNAYSIEKHGFPPGCVNTEDEQYKCDYMVTITLNSHTYPGQVHFKLSGKLEKVGHGYVAVGLSEDDKMGDDHIVECIKRYDSDRPLIYHSWSQFHNTPQRLKDDSDLIHAVRQDFNAEKGYLTCEFTRPLISYVKYPGINGVEKVKKFDLLSDQYCILLATGQLRGIASEDIGFHGKVNQGHAYVSRHPYKGLRSSSARSSWGALMILLPLLTISF